MNWQLAEDSGTALACRLPFRYLRGVRLALSRFSSTDHQQRGYSNDSNIPSKRPQGHRKQQTSPRTTHIGPSTNQANNLSHGKSRFCRKSPHCTTINFTVADNGFNSEKARLLHEGLSGSNVNSFTFVNMALACNYREDEADSFIQNVSPMKELRSTTSFTWGEMTC